VIGHKTKYLRGRDPKEIDEVFRRGTGSVGVEDVPSYPTELDAVAALVDEALPDDVVAVMCLQDRERLDAFLCGRGATVDSPDVLRAKVERAHH
jgi:cyanophycin synthetase